MINISNPRVISTHVRFYFTVKLFLILFIESIDALVLVTTGYIIVQGIRTKRKRMRKFMHLTMAENKGVQCN